MGLKRSLVALTGQAALVGYFTPKIIEYGLKGGSTEELVGAAVIDAIVIGSGVSIVKDILKEYNKE